MYDSTIGSVGYTYYRNYQPNDGYKEINKLRDVPFTKITDDRVKHWDVQIYWDLSNTMYTKDQPDKYAFFPLFPALWRLFHIPVSKIIFFNVFLFVIGYCFFYATLRNHSGLSSSHISISSLLVLAIPSLTIFAIPYAEATSFLVFSLAIFFLVKQKLIPSLLFFILLAWCRPNILMVLGSGILAWALYFIRTKNHVYSIFLLKTLIPGILIGIVLLFSYFYLRSGDFWIFFKAQKHWGTQFQIPAFPFTDYSDETRLINQFLLCVLGPLAILKMGYMFLFEKKEYNLWLFIRFFSVAYFIITCLTVLFFQGGNLHSLHRYVFANPLGLIFIIDLCNSFSGSSFKRRSIFYLLCMFLAALVLYMIDPTLPSRWIRNENDLVFSNTGLYILLLVITGIYWFPREKQKSIPVYICMAFIIFLAITWDTVLFNQYLCRGWLWA
jgi:hypothetical protein